MRRIILVMALLVGGILQGFAQQEKDAEYRRMINQRADKIVLKLAIPDSVKATRVRDVVAAQYRNLNDVYAIRDTAKNRIKAANAGDKTTTDALLKAEDEKATAATGKLHQQYLKDLSAMLTANQIEQIKDGMTYGVLPLTYRSYQEMILTLTDEQKKQILTWLTEARELAMDAESSDKKHAWFGKYKGRINNYLSAAGYDMKKEGIEWQKRIKNQTTN